MLGVVICDILPLQLRVIGSVYLVEQFVHFDVYDFRHLDMYWSSRTSWSNGFGCVQ